MTVPIPSPFLERMSQLLGQEFDAFNATLEMPPVQGLRINTLKIDTHKFQHITPYPLGAGVPWCESAFLVEREQDFGKHPYHRAGLYYLQDPSAMSVVEFLQPQPGERILDLSAAPGGKTTQIAAFMKGRGLLLANDIKGKRVGHLTMNMERWGASNVVVTNETPERLADHFGPWFDRVLVDAPCSGEGMFRKDVGARVDWSPEMVSGCALRQENILKIAARLVRPGGILAYSTCTFSPEENEGVIWEFLKETATTGFSQLFEVIRLPHDMGVMPGKPEWLSLSIENPLRGAARLFPHRIPGEGHFVCMLRKTGLQNQEVKINPGGNHPSKLQWELYNSFTQENLKVEFSPDRLQVFGDRLYLVPEHFPDLGGLRVIHPGVWIGTFKKNRLEPAHPLALHISSTQASKVIHFNSHSEKSLETLNRYLKGEIIPATGPKGWTLVCVDDYPLGWGKQVQGILKNHYPHGWMM